MILDNESVLIGDRVYYRPLDAFFTVFHREQNSSMARHANFGDIIFDGAGRVNGVKQVGWSRPFEAWPTKNQTPESMSKLGAVYAAAKELL